jgi:hypothetical protein
MSWDNALSIDGSFKTESERCHFVNRIRSDLENHQAILYPRQSAEGPLDPRSISFL